MVLYQVKPQPKAWLKVPASIQELIDLARDAGFDIEKLEYWVSKRQCRTDQFLIVLGARRPTEVLGKTDADEWVAFELSRKTIRHKGQACRFQI